MKNKTVVNTCSIDPEVWLDYLEDEVSDAFRADLDLHRGHCVVCKTHLSELKVLRKQIESNKRLAQFPDEAFFKGLEAKIMANIMPAGVRVPLEATTHVVSITRRQTAKVWVKRFTIPAASAAVLFLLITSALLRSPTFSGGTGKYHVQMAQNHLEEPYLVQAAFHNPQVVANAMITSQDEDDLILDATAEKMAHMSETEMRAMMARLR